MQGHPQVVSAITACISEEGDVQDSASDDLRSVRGKLRAVENRLKAILKGHSGEVSEMVCSTGCCVSLCCAVLCCDMHFTSCVNACLKAEI